MPEIGKPRQVPLSNSLPLDATPSDSLAVSSSLPALQNGLSSQAVPGSTGLAQGITLCDLHLTHRAYTVPWSLRSSVAVHGWHTGRVGTCDPL